MHSTNDVDDGYLGSGIYLGRSINKHGLENHDCEKLEFLETRKKLKEREAEIVNEELINDSLCMNLALGGGGGSGCFTKEQLQKGGKNAYAKLYKNTWQNKDWVKRHNVRSSEQFKKLHKDGFFIGKCFTGLNHSTESKRKIGIANSAKQKGELNSQYGTCWITNEKENKKIHRGDDIPNGYRLGRKLKFKN